MTEEDFRSAIESGREISFSTSATQTDRLIQAEWLSATLTQTAKTIKIENAAIAGRFGLQSETIGCTLFFANCDFQEIRFDYCWFSNWTVFDSCAANSLRLRGSHFRRGLSVSKTHMSGRMSLAYLTVDTDVVLDGVVCDGIAELDGMSIQRNLYIRKATFKGPMSLSLSSVGGQVDLNESRFLEKCQTLDSRFGALTAQHLVIGGDASFDRTSVTSSVFLQNSVFKATASLSSFRCDGQLVLNDCTFGDALYLDGVNTTDLFAHRAECNGMVSMVGSRVESCDLLESTFASRVSMHDTRVAFGVGLMGCHFLDETRFDRMAIGSSMTCISSGKKNGIFAKLLSCAGMKVGAQLLFDEVTFQGDVNLESVQVEGGLFVTNCFVNGSLTLTGAHVASNLECTGSAFSGELDATNCSIEGHALFWGATFDSAPQLIRTEVGSTLNFKDAKLKNGVTLDSAIVRNRSVFLGAEIAGIFSARLSVLNSLHFDSALTNGGRLDAWPFASVMFEIEGLKYERIEVQWGPFIEALAKTARGRSQQPFRELERCLRSIGRDDWADAVYEAGRAQAALSYGPPWHISRIGDYIARAVSGYGVKPQRIFWWSLLLVTLGCTFFWLVPGAARPTSISASHYHCDQAPSFSQALGLTLRVISPGDPKVIDGWTVSDCPLFHFHAKPYMFIGILDVCTAVLLPFLVAQLLKLWQYDRREG